MARSSHSRIYTDEDRNLSKRSKLQNKGCSMCMYICMHVCILHIIYLEGEILMNEYEENLMSKILANIL